MFRVYDLSIDSQVFSNGVFKVEARVVGRWIPITLLQNRLSVICVFSVSLSLFPLSPSLPITSYKYPAQWKYHQNNNYWMFAMYFGVITNFPQPPQPFSTLHIVPFPFTTIQIIVHPSTCGKNARKPAEFLCQVFSDTIIISDNFLMG